MHGKYCAISVLELLAAWLSAKFLVSWSPANLWADLYKVRPESLDLVCIRIFIPALGKVPHKIRPLQVNKVDFAASNSPQRRAIC